VSLYKKYIIVLLYLFCLGQTSIAHATPSLYAESVGILQAGLDQPSDVATSLDGRAYVLDGVNGRVVVFTKDGKQDFIFGGDTNLKLPMGIAIADEHVYIADSGNHRIVLFDLQGRFIKSLSLPVAVIAHPISAAQPEPVSLSISDGVITWSDRRNHRLCRTDAKSGEQMRCWGKRGEAKAEFQFPFELAVDRDNYLHVVDVLNARVQVFNAQAQHFIDVGRFGLETGELYRPNGLAFGADGELLVSDAYRGTVSIFHRGRFVAFLQDKQGKRLDFITPTALTVWQDRLYVVETQKNRIRIFRLHKRDMPRTTKEQNRLPSTSQKNCITCHLGWAENYTDGDGKQDGVAPVATADMCYSCHHGVVVDSRRRTGRGEQHPDIHHQRKKTPTEQTKQREDEIPKAFPLLANEQNDEQQLSCGSCHTPHSKDIENADTLYGAHANPWLRVLNKDGDLCQQCHESKLDSSLDKNHPLRGVNHPVGIYLKAAPKAEAKGYAKDKKLHKGLPRALLERGATLGKDQQMICQSCHQIHGAKNEALLPLDTDAFCAECHPRYNAKDTKEAREKGVHPVNIKLDKPINMGDEKITRVTCLSCHSLHEGKQGTPLLKYEYKNGKLCSYCHKEYDAVANSDHDLRVTAKKSQNHFGDTPEEAGLCGACHSLHRGEAQTPFLYAAKRHKTPAPETDKQTVPARDKLCLNCHRKKGIAEKAAVKHFSHPARDMVLRSDPKLMPLTDQQNNNSEFGAIACITCHDPHRWQAKTKKSPQSSAKATTTAKNQDGTVLNSFLRHRGPKGSFCIDCHGLETPIKYKYYHDKFSRNKGADYLK